MADYISLLKADLVEQFKGKENIGILIEVLGKQLQDVFDFFDQLRNERDVYTAVGVQLDRVGEIVGLTRAEAGILAGVSPPYEAIDDDTYRRYIIYKILKNTGECTYYDIVRAIEMFWEGSPIRYTEIPEFPATMIFDFDAIKDAADRVAAIPCIKAGGVGLRMRMHKNDKPEIYVGFAMQMACSYTYDCDISNLPVTFLADENDSILTDENNYWLVYDLGG